MHILIISDAYPPMRTSCATQIYDLAQAFIEQNHKVSLVIPANLQKKSVEVVNAGNPTIYSVRCFKAKDVGYIRRTLAEFVNPFVIAMRLKKNFHFAGQNIDGIVWYSPTIFWGPLVRSLKSFFNCKSYLILRDIFPDWAVDIGLLKKNLIYTFLKIAERYQYDQADFIGLQSPKNIEYFQLHNPKVKAQLELLWNWIGKRTEKESPILVSKTSLAGRKIFVYAGNMGIAQNMEALLGLAIEMRDDKEVGFIFIGRGSEKEKLEALAKNLHLQNILFFDEISGDELEGFFKQCHAGLISLNQNHKTHNIPGKFFSYIHACLPVVAILNPNNDLIELINENELGVSIIENKALNSRDVFKKVLKLSGDPQFRMRCEKLLSQSFSAHVASQKILNLLS